MAIVAQSAPATTSERMKAAPPGRMPRHRSAQPAARSTLGPPRPSPAIPQTTRCTSAGMARCSGFSHQRRRRGDRPLPHPRRAKGHPRPPAFRHGRCQDRQLRSRPSHQTHPRHRCSRSNRERLLARFCGAGNGPRPLAARICSACVCDIAAWRRQARPPSSCSRQRCVVCLPGGLGGRRRSGRHCQRVVGNRIRSRRLRRAGPRSCGGLPIKCARHGGEPGRGQAPGRRAVPTTVRAARRYRSGRSGGDHGGRQARPKVPSDRNHRRDPPTRARSC